MCGLSTASDLATAILPERASASSMRVSRCVFCPSRPSRRRRPACRFARPSRPRERACADARSRSCQPGGRAASIRSAPVRRRASAPPGVSEVFTDASADDVPVECFGQEPVDEGPVGVGQTAQRPGYLNRDHSLRGQRCGDLVSAADSEQRSRDCHGRRHRRQDGKGLSPPTAARSSPTGRPAVRPCRGVPRPGSSGIFGSGRAGPLLEGW